MQLFTETDTAPVSIVRYSDLPDSRLKSEAEAEPPADLRCRNFLVRAVSKRKRHCCSSRIHDMAALVCDVAGDRAVALFAEEDKEEAARFSVVELAAGESNPASGCADMYRQTGEHSGYT